MTKQERDEMIKQDRETFQAALKATYAEGFADGHSCPEPAPNIEFYWRQSNMFAFVKPKPQEGET